eukprot:CAMPEP_0179255832 /NCGR_PEP_ID=MMETSP0797-20121207/23952_1 /TAXON_ID=47934 /ORGANISM="Dinophysis acuminata, Strain DAEP01" /LENGTH=463 /DNA_ID=CAMNT_0020963743 /DNA_START=41 /DNA_END=1428 /DNA_ORIENTATION=+
MAARSLTRAPACRDTGRCTTTTAPAAITGERAWNLEQVIADDDIPNGFLTPSKESKADIEKNEPRKVDLPDVDSSKGEKASLAVRSKAPQTQPAGQAQEKQQAPQADAPAPGGPEDPPDPGRRLLAIAVSVGDHIDQLVLYFSDGTSQKSGSDGGNTMPTFVLADGEYLTAIKGTKTDKYLKTVYFETIKPGEGSKVRRSATLCGDVHEMKARVFDQSAEAGRQICSVQRKGDFCGPISRVEQEPIPAAPPSSGVVSLRAVVVKYAEFIDQIIFWYSDGRKKEFGHTPPQLSWDVACVLMDGESLTEVTSRGTRKLEGITFKSNKRSPCLEVQGEKMKASSKKVTFEAKKGYQIWALTRETGFCGVVDKVEEKCLDLRPAARASESEPRPAPALADATSSSTPTTCSNPASATSASKAPEPRQPKAMFGANDAASPPRPSEAKTQESRTSTMVDTPQVKLAEA